MTLVTDVPLEIAGYSTADEMAKARGPEDGALRRPVMCAMSEPENSNPQPKFTRRSETESICTSCFLTIRTDRFVPLEEAENIHADVCLVGQPSPARFTLL